MTSSNLKFVACALLSLPSCASKFTAAQREALSTVAIAPTRVNPNAYAEPYGGDRQAANQAGLVGVTSQTGAMGGIVGALVGNTIAATQDNMFRGKSKGSFGAVQANAPQVGPLVNTKLTNGVKENAFFASKVRTVSPNSITSKVTSYRLVRNGKSADGELLLVPSIIVEMALTDATGKSLAGGTFGVTGYANPISVYASSAAKSKEGYELAAKMAVAQFTTVLEQKTSN
jgi:hypothetical protein